MRDAAPLDPPTPEIARAYLDEVGSVRQRREDSIDRRSVGFLSILNAIACSLFLYLTIVGVRDGAFGITQPMLFAFIIWGQLAAGVAVRNGVQWQLARRRWVTMTGVTIFCVLAVASMFLAIFAPDDLTDAIVFVAPGIAFFGLAGIGAVQLWQARGHRPGRRRPRPPLTAVMRMATAALGVLLGGLTALMSVSESILSVVLLFLLLFVVFAWLFAGRSSELGLAALGERWRWPQLTAYGLSVVALFASAAWALFDVPSAVPFPAIAGGAVMLVLLLGASIGGRDAG